MPTKITKPNIIYHNHNNESKIYSTFFTDEERGFSGRLLGVSVCFADGVAGLFAAVVPLKFKVFLEALGTRGIGGFSLRSRLISAINQMREQNDNKTKKYKIIVNKICYPCS